MASTKYHEQRISTITYVDAESHFEECASQYPYDPSAGHVLGVSNLLFWSGISIGRIEALERSSVERNDE